MTESRQDRPVLRSPRESPVAGAVEVRRSGRRHRTVSARLKDSTLIVNIPAAMSHAEEDHWIETMLRRFEAKGLRGRLNSDGDLEKRAQELNSRHFEGRLTWNSLTFVTNQTARLGSCSAKSGSIRISAAVAGMPAWVRDYVIVHELAHLIEPNHSADFWALVNRYPLTERARGFLIAKGIEEE